MCASMTVADWFDGDHLGLRMPAHAGALRAAGTGFLTQAFRASGALAADNRVEEILRLQECRGGSTGRKYWLDVRYAQPAPGLHTELFIKFSRDFDDPIRDQGRDQLEAEVRLALLSRNPGFPITVPACYFADYHAASGTGMLITQSLPFGRDGLEPLYEKSLDYLVPQPLAHYEAICRSLARLAAAHKCGAIEHSVARHFPFDPARQSLSRPIRYDEAQLLRRVQKLTDFARCHPRLLPDNIASAQFLARLAREIPRFLQQERAIKQYLHSKPDYIALMHWNANIDNAWFWRDAAGELQCGLLDWGNVSQMNIGLALWGALSAAETAMWDEHLQALLQLFIAQFEQAGGSGLEAGELKRHAFLAAAMMGLSWLMDAPAMIKKLIPALAADATRFDEAISSCESARTQLLMLTNLLNLWQRHDFGSLLQAFEVEG